MKTNMTTTAPDIFTDVHKGIRYALFEACFALGRSGDASSAAAARARLRDALRFIAHHGENEDLFLVPRLETSAPTVYARMRAAHEGIAATLSALAVDLGHASTRDLYHRTCELTARYLDHMREEELELEPLIRAALSAEDLAAFGRRSVERTGPADQRMMLASMLPAMTRASAEAFLAKLPVPLAEELRPLAESPARS